MPRQTPEQTILGYQGAVVLVRRRIQTYARTAWASLGGSYRDADIDRLVAMMVPQVLAAQRQVAGLTDAYIAALSGARTLGIDQRLVTGAAVRAGADPSEVYRRPGTTIYTALAGGTAFAAAAEAGRARLLSLATTDVQLAKRSQQNLSMQSAGVERYRRVLTGSEDCDLCVDASGNLYSTAELLPIHPGCDCDVEPETTGPSIADTLNARASRGAAPDASRIAVHEHGEYGPTLARRGDQFTGPGDLAT